MKKSELRQIIKEEILKTLDEAFVNDKGELEDFNFEDNDLLSKEEFDKYKKEFDDNGLNWLLRQFLILDGEEQRTKDFWNHDISDIQIEFHIPNKKVATLIYDIFQILRSGFKSGYFFPGGATNKDIEDILSNFGSESYQIKKERIQKLAKELSQYATPKELFDNDWDNWEIMAWVDDYDEYIEHKSQI